jgi:hypothetical protein
MIPACGCILPPKGVVDSGIKDDNFSCVLSLTNTIAALAACTALLADNRRAVAVADERRVAVAPAAGGTQRQCADGIEAALISLTNLSDKVTGSGLVTDHDDVTLAAGDTRVAYDILALSIETLLIFAAFKVDPAAFRRANHDAVILAARLSRLTGIALWILTLSVKTNTRCTVELFIG